MKKLFYIGLLGLGLFEIFKVYFIMPMPGSQQIESIDIAYFLHTYRWYLRGLFGLMIIIGSVSAFRIKWRWLPLIPLLAVLYIIYTFNFEMVADHMFLQPQKKLSFKTRSGYLLGDSSLVIGVSHNGEAKAYPVRYIAYHHQVRDTVGGKAVMVTYCTVCRTGRVFEPVVDGTPENFRLVGMDHFNAMFEDSSTKTWWRQATGEAVAGPLKGSALPEMESVQVSASKFFWMYPFGAIMDADESSTEYYDSLARYEKGKSKGELTRTDSLSWKDKSWVIGIEQNGVSKAYDWIELKEKKIINDKLGNVPIVLVISDDSQSFAAFLRPSELETFTVQNDTLHSSKAAYDFSGKLVMTDSSSVSPLKRIIAYQEFWHSWKTFHPSTLH